MKASVEHVALWVRDLEAMREFYVRCLDGASGALYENPRTGLRSYFISFGSGARLELMSLPPGRIQDRPAAEVFGYAHLAFRLGGPEAVDALVGRLEKDGVVVLKRPRRTGDGYYEAVLADPEGNQVEVVE